MTVAKAQVVKFTIELRQATGMGVPPHMAAEVEYKLVNGRGEPMGPEGKYQVMSDRGRDLVRQIFTEAERDVNKHLFGTDTGSEGSASVSTERASLVPIHKED